MGKRAAPNARSSVRRRRKMILAVILMSIALTSLAIFRTRIVRLVPAQCDQVSVNYDGRSWYAVQDIASTPRSTYFGTGLITGQDEKGLRYRSWSGEPLRFAITSATC